MSGRYSRHDSRVIISLSTCTRDYLGIYLGRYLGRYLYSGVPRPSTSYQHLVPLGSSAPVLLLRRYYRSLVTCNQTQVA